MHKDPVCGMNVDEAASFKADRDGQVYYFCSAHCKATFLAQMPTVGTRNVPASSTKVIYICPMHPEIRQDKPGDCPKCGMHLEPLGPGEEENGEQKQINSLSQKFWIGLALTIPLVLLVLGEMLFTPHRSLPFIQLALATPVVLWTGGMFFVKGWKSLVNRSFNMFTLIALGVGAAYGYSMVAVLFPGIFPADFKMEGRINLYFEAAAVITVLIILGQLLAAKARSQRSE